MNDPLIKAPVLALYSLIVLPLKSETYSVPPDKARPKGKRPALTRLMKLGLIGAPVVAL